MNSEKGNTMLFDLDGSLADYDKAMLRDLESIMSPADEDYLDNMEVTLEYAYHYLNPPWLKDRSKLISRTTGWWESLKPVESGFRILKLAEDIGFDIHILTQASTSKSFAWKEKINWCENHILTKHKITITEDKGMVYGKVLYDDWPKYIMGWLKWRPRGLVIMPGHPGPAQKKFTHPNVVKWDGSNDCFNDVARALRTAYERKDLEELKI